MKNKLQRIYSNNGDYIRVARDVDIVCPMLAVVVNSIDVSTQPMFLCVIDDITHSIINIENCKACRKNPYYVEKEDQNNE